MISGATSSWSPVTSRVSQEPALELLLSIIHVDNVDNGIVSWISNFADYFKLNLTLELNANILTL